MKSDSALIISIIQILLTLGNFWRDPPALPPTERQRSIKREL